MRGPRDTPVTGARAALALLVFTAVLLAIGIGLAVVASVTSRPGPHTESDLVITLGFVPPITAFAVVGGLISSRHPRHPVGWLLAVIGALFALVVACGNGSHWAFTSAPPLTDVGEWLSVTASVWVVAVGLLGTQLPLRLPDGHLPSPRWRWFSWLTVVLTATALVGAATKPGPLEGVPGTRNPLGASWAAPLASVLLLVIAAFLVSVVSLVLRYRRSGAHDRAQLRCVAFGGAVFLGLYLVALPVPDDDSVAAAAVVVVVQCAFSVLPIAIGYAMLRHELYDIDVVINRALVYGSLILLLAASYVGGVLLLQLALRPVTRSSDLAVAGSTLAVAALFRPARDRIRAVVDRRFYRSRYDAAQTLALFTAHLRDQLDADALADDICRVVEETVQPTHVSLWTPATTPTATGGRTWTGS